MKKLFTGLLTRVLGPAESPVRAVTPMECPHCHSLWLFWPKEQTGFPEDSLNLRSIKNCERCETGGLEALQSLNTQAPTVLPT